MGSNNDIIDKSQLDKCPSCGSSSNFYTSINNHSLETDIVIHCEVCPLSMAMDDLPDSEIIKSVNKLVELWNGSSSHRYIKIL